MSNEITKVDQNNMVALFGADYGKDNSIMETADYVKLPKIEILKEVAMFKMNGDDNDVVKEVTGYIVGKTTGRAHWAGLISEQKTDEEKKPDCVSTDGKSGSKYSTNCEKCPLNYLNVKDVEAKKTACKSSLNLFIYIEGRGDMPYHLKASATSIKYWTPFALNLVAKYGKVPLCGIKVKLTLKKEVKNNMTYSTVQYSDIGLVESREVYDRNNKLAATFATVMHKNVETAAATVADGTEENLF